MRVHVSDQLHAAATVGLDRCVATACADPRYAADMINSLLRRYSGLNAAGLAAVLGLAVVRLAHAALGVEPPVCPAETSRPS